MELPLGSLTSRQREFLEQLVLLWRQEGRPIHYSELAKRLEVSRFSAYDMLRVLEVRGLVHAHYSVERAGQTAGRSSVFYSPTDAGIAQAMGRASSARGEEWRATRDRLLTLLRTNRSVSDLASIDRLVEQIPQSLSPLIYCGEVIIALLLNLNAARQRASGFNPIQALSSLVIPADETTLGTLAGLSLGAGLGHGGDTGRLHVLFDYTRRYQEALAGLGEDGKRALSEFLRDAIDVIRGAGPETAEA